jgi:hypothetical protein
VRWVNLQIHRHLLDLDVFFYEVALSFFFFLTSDTCDVYVLHSEFVKTPPSLGLGRVRLRDRSVLLLSDKVLYVSLP